MTPVACRWQLPNRSPSGGTIAIAGLDFGGAGPIALLHHANGFCAGTWQLVAERLVDRYHVIAIDARGHGDSDGLVVPQDYAWQYFVDDLSGVAAAVLREHGEASIAHGIGSSFGGIVTAAAAAAHPALFDRITLLDPPIHPTTALCARFGLDIPVTDHKSSLAERTRRRRTHWPHRDEPRAAWRGQGMFADWSPRALDLYLATCLADGARDTADGPRAEVTLKCDPAVEAHIFESTGSLGVLEYAPYVTVPALYVRASTGHVPAVFTEAIAGLFPAGEHVELEGSHLLPLACPEATAALIRSRA